uniref:C-type lectin domain-containing protein n=1 Tax=Neogobius melanostomus TaxID=47308 RepID=A0A8C6UMV6_9GOBI
MTWTEGLQHCSEKGLQYMGEGHWLVEPRDFPVWIGLQRDGSGDDWSWSDGTHSDYRSWTSGPGPGSGSCVAVSSQSKAMLNQSCSKAFPFLCYRHNVVLLQEELSWEDAMETCRNLRNFYNHTSFSMLSVEESEVEYALSHAKGAKTNKVWVGLRFLAGSWFWSDGTPVSLSLPSCPKFNCGALVVNTSSIEPTDCTEKLNLLCYGSGPQFS